MGTMLGIGWNRKCEHCGTTFRAFSHKQKFCSEECAFLGRLKKIDVSGCIEWQGNINNSGYGVMSVIREGKRKMVGVHRHAWERVHGKIPDGLCVCHKCDNPKCVNIDHLFIGTRYDNNHDRSLKNRSGKRFFTDEELYRYSCINSGEKNNSAKLTEEQVIQIKNLRGKCTRKEIAKKFNVSLACIKDIFGGKTWKFLEDNTSKTC